eukprot:6193671-Pleurochrysis_carterae.AAC.2
MPFRSLVNVRVARRGQSAAGRILANRNRVQQFRVHALLCQSHAQLLQGAWHDAILVDLDRDELDTSGTKYVNPGQERELLH